MNEQERSEMLAFLDRTRQEYLSAAFGVTEDQARWKPAPDRWSVLECAEHVAIAEAGMLRLISEKAVPHGRPVSAGRESRILANGADRHEKRTAPERARPIGRFASIEEAVRDFQKHRDNSLALIAKEPRDLRALQVEHAQFGWITAQECLALLIIHPARHAAQIRELREHPQFPR